MRSPYCKTENTRVVDSRDVNDGDEIRRRRECGACKRRFTSYERVEAAALIVAKKDGRRAEFNPDKLIAKVEADLMAMGTKEVSSHDIGEKVLAELKTLDHVAYIRFASVYRQFADIDDLRRERGKPDRARRELETLRDS